MNNSVSRLTNALSNLEYANENLCKVRSTKAYDQMISDGNGDALIALDKARREARELLLEGPKDLWLDIDDAARSGNDVLLYYPLDGLAEYHPRIVIGYWKKQSNHPEGGYWVFQNRATRGYSEGFQPTKYQIITPPVK